MIALDRPRVSLCMIVKNEQANLRECLQRVRELFDEIIVVDTGSSDATVAVATELGAQVHHFPWCDDFAAARNVALDKASGEWIFWLDADDRVSPANVQALRELFQTLGAEPRACVMNTICHTDPKQQDSRLIKHVRLFRRHAQARWTGRVHEQIFTQLARLNYPVQWCDIDIDHLGYVDEATMRRKQNRNLRLLRMDYAERPHDPVVLVNLGMNALSAADRSLALFYFLQSLKYKTSNHDMVRKLYALIVQTLCDLARVSEAIAYATEGLELFPGDPELSLNKADALLMVGDSGSAERLLIGIVGKRLPNLFYMDVAKDILYREGRQLLARVYISQTRFTEAETEMQRCLADCPAFTIGWVTLGFIYLKLDNLSQAEFVARQLMKCDGGRPNALALRAWIQIAQGNYSAARELVETAIAEAPRLHLARCVLAEIVTATSHDLAEKIAAWNDVLRLDPANSDARRVRDAMQAELNGQRPSVASSPSPLQPNAIYVSTALDGRP